jgi:sulfatase maturation enzyme AslB (radical SAM superfamily)
MKNITLSLNPSYECNLRCGFCYLSPEQLAAKKIIPGDLLFQKLSELSARRTIKYVDIYGGEITLVPEDEVLELLSIVRMFYRGKLNLITNFTKITEYFYRDDLEISVSWDSKARARHKEVLKNMHGFKKDFHILMLASDDLMREGVLSLIQTLNEIRHLASVEIKPYSQSVHTKKKTNFVKFENWIQQWIDLRHEMNFDFINLSKITDCLKKDTSSWSDDHLYLTPDGQFAVLDFTPDGEEKFVVVDGVDGYEEWCMSEYVKFSSDPVCGSCKFLGHCLSEHLQKVPNRENSCSGFYNLLENNTGLL